MKLVIVESPNKCGKIKSFLGSEYSVMASVGHIREIPKDGMNIDIKGGTFEPTFVVSSGKKDVVRGLKEAAKKSDSIYLATDADREGESIANHIYDVLDKESQKKCKRITFIEITKKAILDAINKPRDIDKNWVDAQKARQVLDRLIGYKVSPWLIFQKRVKGSSAGRVQSVAMLIVCNRQREIDAFKPEDYWFLEALLKCKNGEFWAKVVTKDKDNKYTVEKIAQEDLDKLKKASYKIDKIEKSEKKNNAPPPFDTNSLQATCSSLFGWSLSKSQTIAQKLYETGKISYIRTDSFNISQEALDEVRKLIKESYDTEYLPKQAIIHIKKSGAAASASQEAHECIRPTHASDDGHDIDDSDEQKMYKLIRDRFFACQMNPQIVDQVSYDIATDTGHKLIAKGQSIRFDGWAKAYKYSKTKEEVLPECTEKENLALKEINKTKHTTKPPDRYNEGSLAKAMEKDGVGRPSTRATIITSIQKKGFVEKDKKSKGLIATELGMHICDLLQPNFKDFFMDIKYTAGLENDLDDIKDGKKKYLEVVKGVYDLLQKHLKDLGETGKEIQKGVNMGAKCSVCKKGDIVEKKGRFGDFLSCSNYPECKTIFTKNEDGTFKVKEKAVVKSTGRKCPECKKNGRDGELVERTNKSNGNTFIACNAYPRCKYIDGQGDGEKGEKKDYKKFVKKDKEVEPEETTKTNETDEGSDDLDL